MRRLLLVVATVTTLAVPASIASVALSGPAWASSGVACTKLSGTISGSFTVTKCTPKNKKDKKATGTSTALATGGGTITWSPSKGTTTLSVSFSQSGSSCPKGSSEYVVSGSVSGGTSTYTSSGDPVSADACVTGGGKLSLVKGTAMDL
jgi:hypothetical protein